MSQINQGNPNISATLTTETVEIGAVELRDHATDARALVGPGTAVAEASNAVATHDASIGVTTAAAVTDSTAAASVIAALKGLLKLHAPSTTGGQGNKVVAAAGTPLQLVAVATPATAVIVTARIGNTKEIAVGFSNAVRATAGAEVGACLQPGDSITLLVADISLVWIDAQITGEGVSYTYTTN